MARMTGCLMLLALSLRAQNEPPRTGIWKSHGYGEILAVDSGEYILYDVTRTTCVERERGKIDQARPLYPHVVYASPEKMIVGGTDFEYALDRINHLPAPCTTNANPGDPLLNFDAFWEELNENYAFFERRHIEWNAMRSTYRARIATSTTERELYGILGEMVAVINDPHVFLSNRKAGAESLDYSTRDVHGIAAVLKENVPGRERAFYNQAANKMEAAIDAVVRYEILGSRFQTTLNDKVIWGFIGPDVAYIRASLFMQMFSPPTPSREEVDRRVEESVDEIFAGISEAKALVIDVGTNTGGADVVPLAIARRIIDKPKSWVTKRVMTPEGLTEPIAFQLTPGGAHRFHGPVVILQSRNTVSAGETLSEVLIGVPRVRRIGTRTLGARSSILMKPLPNGGIVGISNEVSIASDGNSYEVVGVPPNQEIVVFDPQRIVTGYRGAVEAAVALARSLVAEPSRPLQ